MLFHHSKRSLFPLALALITLSLIGLMVFSFSQNKDKVEESQPAEQPTAPQMEESTINEEDYQSSMRDLLQDLPSKIEGTQDNLQKVVVVEDALEKLLDIKVPADRQSVHLETALALNKIKRGLKEGTDAYESGLEELRSIIQSNEWLQ